MALAYRVRFVMQLNAREAMHLLELRTTPQGHPAYRQVGQEMHRLIAERGRPPRGGRDDVASSTTVAEPALERLDAERRAEVGVRGLTSQRFDSRRPIRFGVDSHETVLVCLSSRPREPPLTAPPPVSTPVDRLAGNATQGCHG